MTGTLEQQRRAQASQASNWPHAVGIVALVGVGAWLSSGTLSPLPAVSDLPLVQEDCHYLVDIDWGHHISPYLMLQGEPEESWGYSVVLRRILYPLLSLPFVIWLGYLVGALLFNVLMTLTAIFGFGAFVNRRLGRRSALTVMWLLATYPGAYYAIAMPYAYAAIVPATLVAYMALSLAHETERITRAVPAALLLGLTFLAYDLFPYFLPALALSQLLRRRILWAVLLPVIAMLPSVLLVWIYSRAGIPLTNSNTVTYANIIGSYLAGADLSTWWNEVSELPRALLGSYLFSTYFFLPVLATVVLVLHRRSRLLNVPEVALLISIATVFLFNNLAPPYLGWQMRGEWIARLYQPIFVILLMVVARAAARPHRTLPTLVAATAVLNFAVVLTPSLGLPILDQVQARYYLTAPAQTLDDNLDAWGRRPLGFCQRTHEGDELQRSRGVYQRPEYMYRE